MRKPKQGGLLELSSLVKYKDLKCYMDVCQYELDPKVLKAEGKKLKASDLNQHQNPLKTIQDWIESDN
jgi:hypothetical protein